jgi:20S proteasome alpha/beta subunit
MTCVIGMIKIGGGVIFGADSEMSDGYEKSITADSKVFIKKDVAFGMCGEMLFLQLLKYHLEIPMRPKDITDEEYIVKHLVANIKTTFKEQNGSLEINDRRHFYGSVLIGYRSKIYELQSNFQVIRTKERFVCIGSGGAHARASMLTSQRTVWTEKTRIRLALNVSSKCAVGVSGPFKIVELNK